MFWPGRSKRRSQTPSISVFVRVLCFFLLLSFFLFPLPQQIDADSLLHSGQYAQSLRHNTHNAHNAHTHIHRRPNLERTIREPRSQHKKPGSFFLLSFRPFPFFHAGSLKKGRKQIDQNRTKKNMQITRSATALWL